MDNNINTNINEDLNGFEINNEYQAQKIVDILNSSFSQFETDTEKFEAVKNAKHEINTLGFELYNSQSGFFFDYKFKNEVYDNENKKEEEQKYQETEIEKIGFKAVQEDAQENKVENYASFSAEKITQNKEFNQGYLMVAGTFIPAFAFVGIYKAFSEKTNKNMVYLLFGLGLIAGGYLTSKLLKKQ